MSKRAFSIIIIGFVVLAAGIAALLFLRPAMEARREASPAYNDAWKIELIQGSWASGDEKYELSIDACDCTLKIDGVYAMVARLQFDAAEKLQEGNELFTLQIDPSSLIYPDAEGAEHFAVDALWYEDGMIYMRLRDAQGIESGTVCLSQIGASPQKPWPYN